MPRTYPFRCVYYWMGGTESGRWECADYSDTAVADINRGGRVALIGDTRIGPPDDAPTRVEWADLKEAQRCIARDDSK